MNKLFWHEWTTGTKVPDDVPVGELLLVETHDGMKEFCTATFFLTGCGSKLANVGGQLCFDRNILRWASIQHLAEE